MTSSFQREILSHEFIEEMIPLLREHYLEIAHYHDIVLAPDYDRYLAMERSGHLRVYTIRTGEWGLAGYAIFVVNQNLHYSRSKQAAQDIIFIQKSERGNGQGKEFIAWCDAQLKADGVQLVVHHVKAKANFGPTILEKQGYELIDMIYGKRLDR